MNKPHSREKRVVDKTINVTKKEIEKETPKNKEPKKSFFSRLFKGMK